MKRISAAILLVAVNALTAHAQAPVHIGTTNVIIPPPDQYVLVTPKMTEANRVFDQSIPPANELLAAYIQEKDVPVAIQGGLSDFDRYFVAQVARTSIPYYISDVDFEKIRSDTKEKNQAEAERIEKTFPRIFAKQGTSIYKKYDIYLTDVKIKTVALPIHYQTSNSFAYSMLVKLDVKSETKDMSHKKDVKLAAVVTITFVHIKGKVLFLYCDSTDGDLEWNRRASEAWARNVVAANP